MNPMQSKTDVAATAVANDQLASDVPLPAPKSEIIIGPQIKKIFLTNKK